MEGNSALPPALRDHLTRQVRQHETIFQSSNSRPMTDHDWMRLEERATAAASSKGGKGSGNKAHTSIPGKLALLAWQKLRAAGCKRTLNATAHHKRRNSSDPPILVAGRYKPPDLKSKFEYSVIRKISKDSVNNNNHLTQSKKKQRRLKEIDAEKIMAGIERNKFRRRSAHLVKAVSDAAGIVINQQQKEQNENDDYSNSSRAATDFIKPHQSKLAAAATVFGPPVQQCNSRKLVSGDDATAAASLNDSSVIQRQSSCCHQPPLQQTCQQEGSNLNFKQLHNNSKKSSSSRLVNDTKDINFTSTDDCVKQTDTVTTTTLGLGSIMSSPKGQPLEDHLSSPDGAAASESRPINNCSSSVVNNNNLTLSRPDIIPSLSASGGGGAVSDVVLPTSMFLSSIPYFQLSAASTNAPPPGFGEGWGMRVSNALKNTSIWKSVEESAAVMTDEEPRVPVGNKKDATGGKSDMSESNTAAAAGALFQREKKEHNHLRYNNIGNNSQESNNRLCHVNDVDNNAATGGGGASNSSVQYRTPQTDGSGSGCDIIRGRKGGGNKVPFSVSDNFVRMDLRRKGNFRFKKRKGGGKKKGRERFIKRGWNNNAWRGEEQQGNDDLEECNNGRRNGDAMTSSNKQLQWKTERIEVGRGGREDVLDCCIDMLVQQPEHEEAADGNNSRNNSSTGRYDTPTSTKSHQVDAKDWEKLTPPPLCSVHRKPARVLKVKKAGENRGRYFFVCSQPRGNQCNFFMWVEDVPFLVRKYLMEPCESSEEWLQRRSETLRKDISRKTVAEVKGELLAAGLPNVGGNKAQLIDRLMKHLENLIDDPSLCSSSQIPDVNYEGETESGNDDSQDSNSSNNEMWSSSSSEDELELLAVMNSKESGACVRITMMM